MNQKCDNKEIVFSSGLYGSNQIHYSPCDHTDERQVESVILKYLENHREINTIVHTSANDPLKVDRQDITGNISAVNKKLDRYLHICSDSLNVSFTYNEL